MHHFFKKEAIGKKKKILTFHASRPLTLQLELPSEAPGGSLGSVSTADKMLVPAIPSGSCWELIEWIAQSFPEAVLPYCCIDPCQVPHFWSFSLMWPIRHWVTVENYGIKLSSWKQSQPHSHSPPHSVLSWLWNGSQKWSIVCVV